MVSDADAKAILKVIELILPVIQAALKDIISKKLAFKNLPLEGILTVVKGDLLALNKASHVSLGVSGIA